jgi:hypothetical protein
MTQLLQNSSGQVAISSLGKPWGFLDLLQGTTERRLTLTAIAVALAWAGNSRGDRFGSIRRRCPGSREAVVLRSDAAVTHGADCNAVKVILYVLS